MMNSGQPANPSRIDLDCICLNAQRAARTLARRYDAAFRPIGITSGQFAILAALNRDHNVNIGTLAEMLGLERTTLTRNLAPLEAMGLIMTEAGEEDRRQRFLSLTRLGVEKLSVAMPLWEAAQRDTKQLLVGGDWATVQPVFAALSSS